MKIRTIRKTARVIVLTALVIYSAYCVYFYIANPIHPSYNDCGTVISKSNDEVVIKYGTRTQLYLNVQFEKSGFQSIEVFPSTYFKKQKGDVVCFKMNTKISGWYFIRWVSGIAVLVTAAFAAFVAFIVFLISGDDEDEDESKDDNKSELCNVFN